MLGEGQLIVGLNTNRRHPLMGGHILPRIGLTAGGVELARFNGVEAVIPLGAIAATIAV